MDTEQQAATSPRTPPLEPLPAESPDAFEPAGALGSDYEVDSEGLPPPAVGFFARMGSSTLDLDTAGLMDLVGDVTPSPISVSNRASASFEDTLAAVMAMGAYEGDDSVARRPGELLAASPPSYPTTPTRETVATPPPATPPALAAVSPPPPPQPAGRPRPRWSPEEAPQRRGRAAAGARTPAAPAAAAPPRAARAGPGGRGAPQAPALATSLPTETVDLSLRYEQFHGRAAGPTEEGALDEVSEADGAVVLVVRWAAESSGPNVPGCAGRATDRYEPYARHSLT